MSVAGSLGNPLALSEAGESLISCDLLVFDLVSFLHSFIHSFIHSHTHITVLSTVLFPRHLRRVPHSLPSPTSQ